MTARLFLISFFVILGISLNAQSPLAREVTLVLEQETDLTQVLYQLIDESNVNLSFRNDQIPDHKVKVNLRNVPLRQVLDQLLENTNLSYRAIGQQVILFPAPLKIEPKIVTISGYIEDASSGERLIGANLYDLVSGQGTSSNEYGFFSLQIPSGEVRLRASYLGYQSWDQDLTVLASQSVRITLRPAITLQEILVYARDSTANPVGGLATGNLLGLRETKLLPALAGEQDIIRTAHLLPGITTGADGTAGIQVRGGDAGQNLILLDGVPVYYVNHAFGLFSVFNNSAIRSAQLLRGGFPARYGGRLSSVLDIRMKEGNQQTSQAQFGVGLLSTRLLVEGPLEVGKSSFLLAGRWSFVHYLLQPISQTYKQNQGRDGETDYRFYDVNAKFNYTFSKKDQLFVSFYSGRDEYFDLTLTDTPQFDITDPGGNDLQYEVSQVTRERSVWENTVGSLRWNHVFSDRLFANFSVTFSALEQSTSYNFRDVVRELTFNQQDTIQAQGLFDSGIQDLGIKADWQWLPSNEQQVRFGVSSSQRTFQPGALIGAETIDESVNFTNNEISTTELNGYVEHQGRWGQRWQWNVGTFLALWNVRGTNRFSIQPRLGLSYKLNRSMKLTYTASHMVQHLHFLRNATLDLPTEIWVPSTDRIQPSEAWQTSLGMQWKVADGWQLSLDGYYKRMDHLLEFLEGIDGFQNWEENVTQGEGEAYGVEWQLTKQRGKLTGWVNYTWARSDRFFEELNLGRVYPFRYDRRHSIKLALIYQFNDRWHLSANWTYSTGFATTIPLIKYTTLTPGEPVPSGGLPIIPDPENKNGFRMPDDHRLDFSINYQWPGKKQRRHELNVGLYNAYNRNNPLYYDIRRFLVGQDGVLTTRFIPVEVQLGPLMPTVNYQISF